MKVIFIFGFLLASIPVWIAACGPNNADCTIQVNNINVHSCSVWVSLDGANQEYITGINWTYHNIPPGSHTLNFITTGSVTSGNGGCSGQNPCGFGTANPPPTTQNVTFNTLGGYQYVVTLNNDYNFCGNIVITGP